MAGEGGSPARSHHHASRQPQRSPGLMAGEGAPVGALWDDWHPGCDFERFVTRPAIRAASVVKDQMGSSHGLAFERCGACPP